MRSTREETDYELSIVGKVAEYLSLAVRLRADDDLAHHRRATQLSLELAMLLPTEVYRFIVRAIASPDAQHWVGTAVIVMRKNLHGEAAGELTPDDIAQHWPNAGRDPKKD